MRVSNTIKKEEKKYILPLGSRQAVRWEMDQRWGWPGSTFPVPLWCQTSVQRYPSSLKLRVAPKKEVLKLVKYIVKYSNIT